MLDKQRIICDFKEEIKLKLNKFFSEKLIIKLIKLKIEEIFI